MTTCNTCRYWTKNRLGPLSWLSAILLGWPRDGVCEKRGIYRMGPTLGCSMWRNVK